MKIAGLELPVSLVAYLEAGVPISAESTLALAGLLNAVNCPEPALWVDLDYVVSVNDEWEANCYLGSPSDDHSPGTIEPGLILLIGEAEYDSPIALDFGSTPPQVIYLGDRPGMYCWHALAASHDQLMEMIGRDRT